MTAAPWQTFSRTARTLWADTSGVMLPYVTVMLLVLIGTSALALDAARWMSLQSQLQKAADAAAIAAAYELDRLTTATNRADAAARNLVANAALLSAGDVAISGVDFFTALPASDDQPMPAPLCSNTGCSIEQSVSARFVRVTVTPVTMPTILPVRFFGAAVNTVTTGASAVAGNDTVNCGLTPIFICNPFEQTGDSYGEATQRLEQADADATGASRRTLLRLADPDPGHTWGPGDFGYLTPMAGALAPDNACFSAGGGGIGPAMAAEHPLICVRQNGVNLQTGNATAAKTGLNTRFGIYPQSMASSCKTTYPSDVNVRKAMHPAGGGGWCTPTENGSASGTINWPPGDLTDTLAGPDTGMGTFAVDTCLLGASSCSPYPNIGAATWDCLSYWNEAHPANAALIPPLCTAAATMSRYDVYQYEIANNLVDEPSHTDFTGGKGQFETGAPQCTGATTKANRRIMTVAIVNCQSSPVTIQSNATNVPVAAFADFFLTHAVTNQTKPYAEFRRIIRFGQGQIFAQVQLYR